MVGNDGANGFDLFGLFELAIDASMDIPIFIADLSVSVDGIIEFDVERGTPDSCETSLPRDFRPHFDIDPYSYLEEGSSGSGIEGEVGLVGDPDFKILLKLDVGAETSWSSPWYLKRVYEALKNLNTFAHSEGEWEGSGQVFITDGIDVGFGEIDPCSCISVKNLGKYKRRGRFLQC